jgi:hypothetical protein
MYDYVGAPKYIESLINKFVIMLKVKVPRNRPEGPEGG